MARSHELLVLHQGAIGDFVLTLSVTQPLRRALGVDRIVVIASAASARLAAGRSAVDEYLFPEQVGLHTLFVNDGEIDPRLHGLLHRASTVLSFLGDADTLVHTRLQGVAGTTVVSVDPRPTVVTLENRLHITRQWRDTIQSTGVTSFEAEPPEILGFSALNRNPKRVVLHPGSGGLEKCWPMERFIALADAMRDRRVSWLLGPAEMDRDRHRIEPVLARKNQNEELIIQEDLACVAQRIADAGLYVGNDGGMTHVAAALAVPTVAIFGPSDPRVWGPLNRNVAVVASSAPGPISQITGDEVIRGLERILADAGEQI